MNLHIVKLISLICISAAALQAQSVPVNLMNFSNYEQFGDVWYIKFEAIEGTLSPTGSFSPTGINGILSIRRPITDTTVFKYIGKYVILEAMWISGAVLNKSQWQVTPAELIGSFYYRRIAPVTAEDPFSYTVPPLPVPIKPTTYTLNYDYFPFVFWFEQNKWLYANVNNATVFFDYQHQHWFQISSVEK